MRIELLLFLSFMAILVVLIACSVPRRPTPRAVAHALPAADADTVMTRSWCRAWVGKQLSPSTILPPEPQLPEIEISPPRCYRTSRAAIDLPGLPAQPNRSRLGGCQLAGALQQRRQPVRISGEAAVQPGAAGSTGWQPGALPPANAGFARGKCRPCRSSLASCAAGHQPAVWQLTLLKTRRALYQPETGSYRYHGDPAQ